MQQNERVRFSLGLNALALALGCDIPKNKCDVFFESLSAFSLDKVLVALNELKRAYKPEFGRQFPTPAEIIETIQENTKAESMRYRKPFRGAPKCRMCGDTGHFSVWRNSQPGAPDLSDWPKENADGYYVYVFRCSCDAGSQYAQSFLEYQPKVGQSSLFQPTTNHNQDAQ